MKEYALTIPKYSPGQRVLCPIDQLKVGFARRRIDITRVGVQSNGRVLFQFLVQHGKGYQRVLGNTHTSRHGATGAAINSTTF